MISKLLNILVIRIYKNNYILVFQVLYFGGLGER